MHLSTAYLNNAIAIIEEGILLEPYVTNDFFVKLTPEIISKKNKSQIKRVQITLDK